MYKRQPEDLAHAGASSAQLRDSLNKVTAGLSAAQLVADNPATPPSARQSQKLGNPTASTTDQQLRDAHFEQLRRSAPLVAQPNRPTAWEDDTTQEKASDSQSTSLSLSSSGEATAGAVGFSGSVTIHH